MSDLVERVTRALDTWVDPEKVRDAIDVVLEEAAKVADGMWWQGHGNLATAPYAAAEQAGDEIAAAIRALKGK